MLIYTSVHVIDGPGWLNCFSVGIERRRTHWIHGEAVAEVDTRQLVNLGLESRRPRPPHKLSHVVLFSFDDHVWVCIFLLHEWLVKQRWAAVFDLFEHEIGILQSFEKFDVTLSVLVVSIEHLFAGDFLFETFIYHLSRISELKFTVLVFFVRLPL